jgi:zinc/manganese transport system substrate-binding protein
MINFKNFQLNFSKILFCFAMSLTACKDQEKNTGETKPSMLVVCSFSILSNFVEEITKNLPFVVYTLVPLNADPHLFEPKPDDLKKIDKADLIVINGLGLEGWMERMFDKKDERLVVASQRIESRSSKDNVSDPHAWHDVKNAIKYVEKIRDSFIEKDKKNTSLYTKNASLYINRLLRLDKWIKECFKEISEEKRLIVTTHDAFWYFSKSYKVTFFSPIGSNTDSEAVPHDVANLISLIKTKNINAIFIEKHAFPTLIQEIAKETGKEVAGTLFADGLSDKQDGADTYERMMSHNVSLMIKSMTKSLSVP